MEVDKTYLKTLIPVIFLAFVVFAVAMSTVKIAKEYERGVVLRLGRLIGLDMGSNQNSTIVFPIPIELLRPLLAAPVPMKAVAAGNGVPASVGRIPGVV